MKFRTIYTTLFLVGFAFFFYNSSGGAAAVQGQDRTGSPLSGASCQFCHFSGSFAPTLEAELLEAGNPVTNYEGGKTYTLRVTISPTAGNPSRFGFQAVALTTAGNDNAGSFQNPPAGLQITELNSRQYAEHSTPSTGTAFEIEWQAPPAGTGEVRFFAAGVAANNGNGSGGDSSARLGSPLTVSELLSSNEEALAGTATFDLLHNPVRDRALLRLQITESRRYQLRLFDAAGRTLQSRDLPLPAGEETLEVEMEELKGGLYFISLSDGNKVVTKKVLKI